MKRVIEGLDGQVLDLVQKEFPMVSRPFAAIGEKLGISEGVAMTRMERLTSAGIIRQISAIFDSRRLGYDSSLVAMELPPERLDGAAEVINRHRGVSHNYARSHRLNLWFTIATPPGCDLRSDVGELTDKVSPKKTLLLPALRMFKLCVKLDVSASSGPLSTEVPPSSTPRNEKELPPLTEREIRVIRELQENLPLERAPFQKMAERLRMEEEDLFSKAKNLMTQGRMRRFAAVLRHREAGFKANAMGVWTVPPHDVERVGETFASFQAVSHCYERPPYPPLWPYNIFTMVHARTVEECQNILRAMAEKSGIMEYDYLFSVKEYKKARVRYFVEAT